MASEDVKSEGLTIARRACLICGGKLDKLEMKDRRWSYLEKTDYYACQSCRRRWLYSPDLTCPVLLGEQANK